MGEPKSSPIQKIVPGFPEHENDRVTTIDVDFRYPVIEPFVKQMAHLLGMDENKVRMVTADFDTANATESDSYANQAEHSPLLKHTELEDAGKEAAKAYGGYYLESIKKQTADSKIDIPYEGKKTPDSFDPFKPAVADKLGINSPMSKMTRPAKPATGAAAK